MSDEASVTFALSSNVPSGVLPLPRERNLFFTEQVDQASISKLTQAIIEINKNDAFLKSLYPVYHQNYVAPPINIYIDSYGGYVYQCFGLLSVMNSSSGQ